MRKIIICILVLILCGSFICCTYASEKLFDNKYDALKVDPIEEYWMVVFTFGSGGESEIPYLLQYIHDENRNIRFNSLVMLGNWLLAYDCKEQLVDLYWKESDQEIKLLILSNLERLITNLRRVKSFLVWLQKMSRIKKLESSPGNRWT
jgi:hypothetical protein